MAKPTEYIPGPLPTHPGPLARFLPPIPDGVISYWLKNHLPEGSLVLDPFGAQPKLTIEAARAGYRVIVTANNPVTRFILEMSANTPKRDELDAILADLAATRRGQERLEPHIRNLYLTTCENCGREVEAQAFIWERESRRPIAKIYTCQHCGSKDSHPTNEQDILRAAQFDADRLHRSRALERVAAPDDPDRHHVEEALETYLPRSLYALFTLINRLDSGILTPVRRHQLELLLLSTADYANCLWAYPPGRARPRLLTLSPKYFEHNIWMALENAIPENIPHQDDEQLPQIQVTNWPDLPNTHGGISIYDGRLKELIQPLQEIKIQSVINAIPRPNQAFWTLSALWAGWLWGKDAVRPFKSVLRRRRYDWNWHSAALHAIFDNLYNILDHDIPVLGLIAEAEPSFLSASTIAAELAGFNLTEYALRSESMQAQLTWKKHAVKIPTNQFSRQELMDIAARASIQYLKEKAEPASFLQTSSVALFAMAEETRFNLEPSSDPAQSVRPMATQAEISDISEEAFSFRNGFLRLGGSEKSPEVGQYWLADDASIQTSVPIADRIEINILDYLRENPGASYIDIDRAVCGSFPGLLTPSSELVNVCINSYGEQRPENMDQWYLRQEDDRRKRVENVISIQESLSNIAVKLDFSTQAGQPLLWLDEKGEVVFVFYIISTAIFGEVIQTCPYPASKSILVIPASRANLALLKQKRNASLSHKIAAGWRFLKYRHVFRMLTNPLLDRDNFDHQLSLDPLQDITLQMRLL